MPDRTAQMLTPQSMQGILLEGPPGTGKTYLAKAMAGNSKLPFYSAVGSEFVEMFQGVAATRIRNLFKAARATAPSIVFIGSAWPCSLQSCGLLVAVSCHLFHDQETASKAGVAWVCSLAAAAMQSAVADTVPAHCIAVLSEPCKQRVC